MPTGLKKWRDGIGPWAAEKGHTDSGKAVYSIAEPWAAKQRHTDSDESTYVVYRRRPYGGREEACRQG